MRTSRQRRPAAALLAPGLLALALAAGCGPDDESSESQGSAHPGIARELPVSNAVTVCAGGATLKGVDVYHGDGTVNWAKVAASGRAFGIVKATEGLTFTDSAFQTNWAGMKQAGLIRGAYHFFHSKDSGSAQADFYLSVVGSLGAGDLPPVFDWEWTTDGQTNATEAREAQAFIDRIRAKTGLTTIIYTSANYLASIGNPSGFGVYPLWDAQWSVSCPNLPPSWTRWAFWQDSDKGTVPGIGTAVDTDQFNGTLADLQALAGEVAGTPDAGTADAGVADAGVADAGVADAGVADAGAADAGAADAGAADAGAADAGAGDAGAADAGAADAGAADAGAADAGATDAGAADAGAHDAGTSDAGSASSDAGGAGSAGSDAGPLVIAAPSGGCGPGTPGSALQLALLLGSLALRRRRPVEGSPARSARPSGR